MQHYHVISGPRNSKTPVTLKFKDRMEGIASFIEMAKIVWGQQETPPPYKHIKKNEKVSIIRIQDEKHRLIFVFCDNICDDDDELEFKVQL